MTPYDVYVMHTAVKLHFSSPTYDYFKYNGKVKASEETFEKNKQKYVYAKIQKQYNQTEMLFFLASSTFNGHKWVRDLISDECRREYLIRLTTKESLHRVFVSDVKKMSEEYDKGRKIQEVAKKFIPENGNHPNAFRMYMENEIHPETLITFNAFGNIFDSWEKSCDDDIVMKPEVQKLRKYSSFFDITDSSRYRKAFEDVVFEVI